MGILVQKMYENWKWLPCDVIYKPSLKQKIATRQQIVTDQILICAHSHSIANTQWLQNI